MPYGLFFQSWAALLLRPTFYCFQCSELVGNDVLVPIWNQLRAPEAQVGLNSSETYRFDLVGEVERGRVDIKRHNDRFV